MKNSECPCSGSTLDRLLRPTVMAVLAREPGGLHGYLIAQRLRGIAVFGNHPPDYTGLYRVLKAMEEEGCLQSGWETEGSRPARRSYILTDDGRDCLREWTRTLAAYSRNLQQTLRFIQQSVPPVRRKGKR